MARTATPAAHPLDQVQAQVHRAALHASPAIAALARAGYAAKGAVYVLVGGLALLAAVGSGGATTGSRGAMRTVLDGPFGRVVLAVIAAGLAGFALWCFVRAFLDPQRDGTTARGWARRAGEFGKGVVNAALALAAVGMLRGSARSAGGDGQGVRDWTARLMSFPMGVWLVGLVGLGVLAYGLRQVYRGYAADMDDPLDMGRAGAAARAWAVRLSRFGTAARGVVFAVIGVFLTAAAYHANPREAKGVGDALGTLARQPYGPVLLGAVALGLVSYGLYQLVLARYRRIEAP
jgi:hypothetical protein